MKKIALFALTLAIVGISFDAAAQTRETAAQKAQREKTEALQRELEALKKDKAKAEEAARKEKEMIEALPKEAELIVLGHIQNEGDRTVVQIKPTVGTRGKARRIEGFSIKMSEPALRDKIRIVYDANMGPSADSEKAKKSNDCRTTKAGKDGEFAGVKGSSCELLGFRVSLEGEYARYYSVVYKAHQAELGDTVEYRDGATCGSAKRLEEITIWVVKK